MSNDPLQRIAALRPTEDDLAAAWPTSRRSDVLATILDGDRSGHLVHASAPSRRRRQTLAPIAAGTAVIAVATTATVLAHRGTVPGFPAAAGGGASAGLTLGPHQFAYTVGTAYELRHGKFVPADRGETWVAPDGRLFTREHRVAPPKYSSCYAFPARKSPNVNSPTQAFLRSMPTDVAALTEYLRSRVSGSDSRDEAVFVAITDTLQDSSGLASQRLRAAFLGVLERTDHVSVDRSARTPLGRSAVRVDFVDEKTRPGEIDSAYLDPSTYALVGQGSGARQPSDTSFSSITVPTVVNSVPAALLKCPQS